MKSSRGAAELRPSSVLKRESILAAAQEQFLAQGYEAVTMDSIARASGVAKQTLYSHFGGKEALFLELVGSQTRAASERVLGAAPAVPADADARAVLAPVLQQQLETVLAPGLLALRRLVIGLLSQFPDLARELHLHGPQRAIDSLAEVLAALDASGALRVDDPSVAAAQLNWLVMGEPVNRAMLLGDGEALAGVDIETQVSRALDVFLAAYRAEG
ncbi:TetR/AcrR family transcriptional regulator [Streptomyces sp. AC495_CC817]|uniref:TetR/AcrR family transcriptional regulator n=1 Tax=Streptomyces sp. AC495_CC817 TaxID=2823900 RepID=UPI001C25A650|nr:TetR/AcrR family transcriptional regulator [Streptomyces sp. AC495_CC817]